MDLKSENLKTLEFYKSKKHSEESLPSLKFDNSFNGIYSQTLSINSDLQPQQRNSG